MKYLQWLWYKKMVDLFWFIEHHIHGGWGYVERKNFERRCIEVTGKDYYGRRWKDNFYEK